MLTLLAISPQFANAVTLKGHVAQPLRYPFTPGMRIRDLIPDRDALITPDFYRRKNLLVQVIEDDDERGCATQRRAGRRRRAAAAAPPTSRRHRRQPPMRQRRAATGAATRARQRPSAARPTASTGATARRARRDAARRAQRARGGPRRGRRARGATPAALFDELNWDYATIERLNAGPHARRSSPFNLGKVGAAGRRGEQHRAARRATSSPSTARRTCAFRSRARRGWSRSRARSTRPASTSCSRARRCRALIARAGGFTPQAYVYGLDLSREETRARQRENLATAITRLESLSAVQAARDAANRRDDAAGAATTTAVSNAATQAQLARLSRIEPNGRIALELTPETHSIDALPDLPLEHGDRISVPPRPGFVTVAGAVVNSNAFVWKPGRTAGDYLRLAGADEAADTLEHVHPARRRHRQQRRRPARLLRPRRPRVAGRCSRATRWSCRTSSTSRPGAAPSCAT